MKFTHGKHRSVQYQDQSFLNSGQDQNMGTSMGFCMVK